jgi:hypothetical protein
MAPGACRCFLPLRHPAAHQFDGELPATVCFHHDIVPRQRLQGTLDFLS